ncbi:MAG: heavy metal-associated domain-containing protein [Spirochaetes bacterium]|jgi:copper chaperone CopZ|nr:heavy metal-associated domain-containing protein [Spirochaetota bacterium]
MDQSGTIQSIELAVVGMHCDSCVQRVRAALLEERGIERVAVTLGKVLLDYYPEAVTVDGMRAKIEALGYGIPVPVRSRHPLRRFIDRMAAANEKAFGHERLECCTMRMKKK